MNLELEAKSPDEHGYGLTGEPVNALRYDDVAIDPWETSGLLRKRMPKAVRVLDVGCGTGSMTVEINKDLGNEVVGVEPDSARANLAKERGLNVVLGVADPGFFQSSGKFDVIVFSDVLEHLPSPAETIELAAQALAPNGRILASIPNVAHWTVRVRLLFGKFDYAQSGIMDATHLRWFTAKTVKELFERCGLEVVSMQWSAGTWMPEYRMLPFRLFPVRLRNGIIHKLTRAFPTLFGCQHIVEAVLRRPVADGANFSA
jgi:SAM-dependent methyltransferase